MDAGPCRQAYGKTGRVVHDENCLAHLQPNDHPVGLLAVGQPVGDGNLAEHVKPAVQVLRVRDLHNRQQANLGKPLCRPEKGGFVGRKVAHALSVLLRQVLRHQVVPAVLYVLPQVHSLGGNPHVGRQPGQGGGASMISEAAK